MRHLLFIFPLLFLNLLSFDAQTLADDPTFQLTRKGRLYTGISTSGIGFASPNGRLITAGLISPKIGYMVFNRLSTEFSLRGFGMGRSGNKNVLLFNSDLGLNYFLYARKNLTISMMAGVSYGSLQNGFKNNSSLNLYLKTGPAVSWRFVNNPNFGLTFEANYYLDPKTLKPVSFFPTLSVGINYYFNKPRSKRKPQNIE